MIRAAEKYSASLRIFRFAALIHLAPAGSLACLDRTLNGSIKTNRSFCQRRKQVILNDAQTPAPKRPGRPRAENPRTERITVRLLPEELAKLEEQAAAARIQVSVLARKKVADSPNVQTRSIAPETESAIRSIYAELGKIGSNLNQIARGINAANLAESPVVGTEIREQVNEMKYALRGIMDWLDRLS